jgi:hypothetical protein
MGIVKIAVEFGANGEIGFVFPYQTLPDRLTESVINATKSIKFSPAEKDGKPVTIIRILEYSFSVY